MSVHSTFATDGNNRARREFLSAAQQQGSSVMYTTSIPPVNYDDMLNKVLKLKPQKRKNWKGVLANTSGQHTRVRYVEDGIQVPGYDFVSHFENKLSGQMQAKYATEEEWRVVIPRGLPRADIDSIDEVIHLRDRRDVRRDNMSSWEQTLDIASETLGNLTGNHEPRNHHISIPTRAGEPVRG